MLKIVLVIIALGAIGQSCKSEASDKAKEIMAKEMVRQMQCNEKAAKNMASVGSKCGSLNGGISAFGFNLPDDYSAREALGDWEENNPAEYTCSTFEMEDRIIEQCRMDHTNQIKPAHTITTVTMKSDIAYKKAWEE